MVRENECPICYEEYDYDDRKPCIGTCGHTVCDACRSSLMTSKCPQCNRDEAFAVRNVNQQLLELLRFARLVTVRPIPEHEIKESEKCKNCGSRSKRLRICLTCAFASGLVKKRVEPDDDGVAESSEAAIQKASEAAICGDCALDQGHLTHSTMKFDEFVEKYSKFLTG